MNGYDLKGPRFLWSHPKDSVADRLAVELSQSVDFNDVGLSRFFYVYFFYINVYCINVPKQLMISDRKLMAFWAHQGPKR